MAIHQAVAGDFFDGVSFRAVLFPRDVLDAIWAWIESVPENFPTYSYIADKHTICEGSIY